MQCEWFKFNFEDVLMARIFEVLSIANIALWADDAKVCSCQFFVN